MLIALFNGHGDILPCFLRSFQVEVHNVKFTVLTVIDVVAKG